MARRIRRDDGFTIIEVLVAALILVLGAIATFGVLASATVNNQRAKATQIALNRAQQELEALRSLSDEELALTATPPHLNDAGNPDYRVNNGKFAINRNGSPTETPKELVVENGVLYPTGSIKGAKVDPGPTPFTSGDVKGEIYRYIVWRNDANCPPETCPGEQDYKQIIVAVKLDPKGNGSSPGGYVEVQSDFVNPEHSSADNPIPGAEGVVTAQQLFLTDTPCAAAGVTSRQEITGSHPLHNTLGTCASGAQAGSTKGAPDALLTGAPPDLAPQDESIPALYDYSDDYVNTSQLTAETSYGIQIRREETSGCNYSPEGTGAQWQIHRWVTDPLPKEFIMTSGESVGAVTIDFFTRALSDSVYTGKLCIYLFVRHEEGSPPVAEDKFLANREGGLPYWTYTSTQGNGQWWRNEWREVRLTMKFNGPVAIPAGDRLGVALSVDATTGGDAIPILYDHPKYRTRVEVATTTPLEGG